MGPWGHKESDTTEPLSTKAKIPRMPVHNMAMTERKVISLFSVYDVIFLPYKTLFND